MRIFMLAAALAMGCTKGNISEVKSLSAEKDKVSYSIAFNMGKNMAQQGVEIDMNAFVTGLKHGLSETKPLITEDEQRSTMMAFQTGLREKQTKKREEDSKKNEDEGKKFLEENKGKPGITTLPSGLQYKVLTEGKGPKPKETDTVVTHYKGTLIDGTEFDSSYGRGNPATFPVNGVIKGWTEALQLMPVGSKWQLFIPSDLAYGERGSGPKIGPHATLVFEVELLEIKGKETENADKKG